MKSPWKTVHEICLEHYTFVELTDEGILNFKKIMMYLV